MKKASDGTNILADVPSYIRQHLQMIANATGTTLMAKKFSSSQEFQKRRKLFRSRIIDAVFKFCRFQIIPAKMCSF